MGYNIICDKSSLYASDEYQFLANHIDGFCDNAEWIPVAITEWYNKIVGIDTSSGPYLIRVGAQYGVTVVNEYDESFCQDKFGDNLHIMRCAMRRTAQEMRKDARFAGFDIFLHTNSADLEKESDEIAVFIPFETDIGTARKLIDAIDQCVYEIPEIAVPAEYVLEIDDNTTWSFGVTVDIFTGNIRNVHISMESEGATQVEEYILYKEKQYPIIRQDNGRAAVAEHFSYAKKLIKHST